MLITFGKLRILDLGDLTWDKEMELMCPVNKLGRVDLLVVSHHGWDQSSTPAGVCGPSAGGDHGQWRAQGRLVPTLATIQRTPGMENLWQLHFAEDGKAQNSADEYLANLPGPDSGNYLEVTATPDGGMTVLNSRTQKTKNYAAK